jgi:hypothetical protein
MSAKIVPGAFTSDIGVVRPVIASKSPPSSRSLKSRKSSYECAYD